MNKPKLWTKDFVLDTFINLFTYIVFYLLIVMIVEYATSVLHATPSQAGLATGMVVIAALFGRLAAGRLLLVWGSKYMLYIGLIISLLATLAYFVASSLLLLNVVRFVHGIGFAFASTAAGTIVANIVPKERRGEGIGYYALSVTIAAAIGPFLGMYMLSHYGNFNMILTVCSILSAISCLVMFAIKVPIVVISKETMQEQKKFKLENFVEYKVIPVALAASLTGFAYSSVIGFLSSYTRQLGLVEVGSMFFVVYAIFSFLARPITGPLIDTKGENYVMYPCLVLFAIGLVCLAKVDGVWLLLIAAAFVGLGYGSFTPSAQTIAVKLVPAHRIGLATSTLFAILDAGVGIGPFVLGLFVPIIGLSSIYMYMAVVVVISIGMYYLTHGKKTAVQ